MEPDKQPVDPRFLDLKASLQRKIQIRRLNLEAVSQYIIREQEVSNRSAKVSVVQKFNSKLKSDNRSLQALTTESKTLNLTNYLEEVANILSQTITQKEVEQICEMASVMSQYYSRFSTLFIPLVKKQLTFALANPDSKKNLLKAVTHLIAELLVCGLPVTHKDISELIRSIFKAAGNSKVELASEQERKQRIYEYNSEIYAVLTTRYNEVLIGKTSKQAKEWESKGWILPKSPNVFPKKNKDELASFFEKYVRELSGLLEGNFKLIKETEATMVQQLKLNGNFNQETERKYRAACDRFVATRARLFEIAASLDEPIANFEVLSKPVLEPGDISKAFLNINECGEIFENEYEQELYEQLPIVPEVQTKITEDDKALYEAFKGKLDTCKNTSDADEVVKQFLRISTKRNRKALVRDLLMYRKEYQLVTPFLCRVAATLNQKWKDINEVVLECLFSDYDKFKEPATNEFVGNDRRTRNMKYICEFTKFQMVDPLRTLACIKELVDDLNGFNIELLVSCLDFVGRYLYMNPVSSQKFNFLLTQLTNILKKKSLPIMIEAQIINSMNLLKPSSKVVEAAKVKPEKTPFEKACKSLLITLESYVDDHIRQLRKLQDQYPEQFEEKFLKLVLKYIPRYKYTHNYVFAKLIKKMKDPKLEKALRVAAKERLFTSVTEDLSQECLEWARFEGELFNEYIIQKQEVYDTIYQLLKIEVNPIGVINAVCAILEATKKFKIEKVSSFNQKLRLLFEFKKYVNSRKYIPMFTEFQILDILEEVQPEVMKMSNKDIADFEAVIREKRKNRRDEVDQLAELRYQQKPKQYKEKPNKYRLKQPAKQEEPPAEEEDERREIQRSPEKTVDQQLQQAFDKEFSETLETELHKTQGRMIKKHKIDQNFEKKKDRKKAGEASNGPSVSVIGRVGDALVRRDIRIKMD